MPLQLYNLCAPDEAHKRVYIMYIYIYVYIYTILESSVTLRHSTHVAIRALEIYLYLDPFFRSLQGFLDSKDNLLVGQGTRILILTV